MSGVRIGGSGSEMSSKAIVSRIPGRSSASERVHPERASSASAIAGSTSARPFSGGGG
jgi:hypothetical protein